MDFLPHFLTINTLVYALLGIPALVGFVVMMRMMRKGRSNFTERHKAMDQRILQTSTEVDELNKTLQEGEQLHIIAAALREATRLHPQAELIEIDEQEHFVRLALEKQTFFILYKEKKHNMRSTGKTVYGQGHFEVQGPLPLSQTEPLLTQEKDRAPHKAPWAQGKIFYSLMELELYLTQKFHVPQAHNLPPALRKKSLH